MLQGLALHGFLDQIGQKQKTSYQLPRCALSRGGAIRRRNWSSVDNSYSILCKYLCVCCRLSLILPIICIRNRSKSTTMPNSLCMLMLATHKAFGRILFRKRSESPCPAMPL